MVSLAFEFENLATRSRKEVSEMLSGRSRRRILSDASDKSSKLYIISSAISLDNSCPEPEVLTVVPEKPDTLPVDLIV